jgi:hypothetical protein
LNIVIATFGWSEYYFAKCHLATPGNKRKTWAIAVLTHPQTNDRFRCLNVDPLFLFFVGGIISSLAAEEKEDKDYYEKAIMGTKRSFFILHFLGGAADATFSKVFPNCIPF